MEAKKIHLDKDNETYLITLYGKALDNRTKNPILGDKFADEAVRRIDFEFENLKSPKGASVSLPVRAKHIDNWAREFLAANPDATVLHLGCGLDSRVFRIDPPATVRWYDVDFSGGYRASKEIVSGSSRLRYDWFFRNRSRMA